MDLKNVKVFQDYVRKKLFQKFGKKSIIDKFAEYIVPFSEYSKAKNIYQITFYDNRIDCNNSQKNICFLNKEIATNVIEEMKNYNQEIEKIYDELFKNIIDNDCVVSTHEDFKKHIEYEQELCDRFNVSYKDFDWRVLSEHISDRYLGYKSIYFFERNESIEKAEEEASYRHQCETEQYSCDRAFRNEVDFWKYKEGHNIF